MLASDDETTKTVADEIRRDLTSAYNTFQKLAMRAVECENSDEATKNALVEHVRSEAAFYVSWSRPKYQAFKNRVKSMPEGDDKDTAKYYLECYGEIGHYACELEFITVSERGFRRSQQILAKMCDEAIAGSMSHPIFHMVTVQTKRLEL